MPQLHEGDRNRMLLKIIEFILREATAAELTSIRDALERRLSKKTPAPDNRPLDETLEDLVKQTTGQAQEQFRPPGNKHNLARDMVTKMIRSSAPNIADRDLKILLDEWVPPHNIVANAGQDKLPPEAVFSMVEQFVGYATDVLPGPEERELRRVIPEWPQKYWEIFSPATQAAIRNYLQGAINGKQFWELLKKSIPFEEEK